MRFFFINRLKNDYINAEKGNKFMKMLTKAIVLGLSTCALAGCSFSFLDIGGEGGVKTELVRTKFIEEANGLKEKCDEEIESINELTIKVDIEGAGAKNYSMTGTNGKAGWTSEDEPNLGAFYVEYLTWSTTNMSVIARAMEWDANEYKNFKFWKILTGGYVINDSTDTYTFDSNGVLIKHINEFKYSGLSSTTTRTYSF